MKTTSSHFIEKPHTKLGWWAVWLGAAFAVLFLINSFVFMPPTFNPSWGPTILPFYGIFMILCGLASGVVGLIAIIRRHERSWLVWLPLVPGLFVLFLVLGEFLFPH
jgi:hypothetical protein